LHEGAEMSDKQPSDVACVGCEDGAGGERRA
jgi:hypothetical protein